MTSALRSGILPAGWFNRENTPQIARELLGKFLFAAEAPGGSVCGGMIVETEAYCGTADAACHARDGRRTPRTETMYGQPGIAYVYLCYGMHRLLNVVTHREGEPHAILLRALEPVAGQDQMLLRRGTVRKTSSLCSGPGSLTRALGITLQDNNLPLDGQRIWLEDRGVRPSRPDIACGPRVGVRGAGPEAAAKPWRFWLRNHPAVSRWVA